MPASILIVDDEKHTREGLQQAFEDEYNIYLAANADEAFNLLESDRFDIVLTDLKMTGKSGLKVIEKAVTLPYRPIAIMMTAYGNVETAVQAMKRGATDFLTKPVNLEKLDIIIKRALQTKRLETENEILHERLDKKYHFDKIIGHSDELQKVIEQVKLVAPSKATILIGGPTGSGKELIAQAIHQNSDRTRNVFIPVHCAALPVNLLESELFGHEKGAFTGATERRIGRFEAADSGTLFLDEIGEIDASIQVKLLRFLETKTLERLGSIKPITVNVRLVVATNRDLKKMVEKGEFREDLYYRLNVITINLPPLSQRSEDIPLLLDHFICQFSKENQVNPVSFSPDAKTILQNYSWPGNVRELRNFAENIVVIKRGTLVTKEDLDPKFSEPTDGRLKPNGPVPIDPSKEPASVERSFSVETNEKTLLRDALYKANGNRTKAAELLGISRRTLHRKLLQWPELETKAS